MPTAASSFIWPRREENSALFRTSPSLNLLSAFPPQLKAGESKEGAAEVVEKKELRRREWRKSEGAGGGTHQLSRHRSNDLSLLFGELLGALGERDGV